MKLASRTMKHPRRVGRFVGKCIAPRTKVLVEGRVHEHPPHIIDIGNIPAAQVLVEGTVLKKAGHLCDAGSIPHRDAGMIE